MACAERYPNDILINTAPNGKLLFHLGSNLFSDFSDRASSFALVKQAPIRYPPAGKSVKKLRISDQVGPDNRDPKMLARKGATLPRVELIFF
jgi:hypothetical protein